MPTKVQVRGAAFAKTSKVKKLLQQKRHKSL